MRFWLAATAAALALGACSPQPAVLTGEALLQRGDYLVNGVVLCGDCHTPRAEGGESGPPDLSRRLHGGPANYSEEQFIAMLQTGVRPDGSHPRPPMPPYRLNEEDARAVSTYIRSLPTASD
jgi:mono/diheme cytochrome c family protein